MKKYSFLIISLFLSSTLSYGHGITYELDAIDIAIGQSTDPIGFIQMQIQDCENLLLVLTQTVTSSNFLGQEMLEDHLNHIKAILDRLYSELYDLAYEPLE